MDGCFGCIQNMMDTFSEVRYNLYVKCMAICDHHSNIIAATLYLET